MRKFEQGNFDLCDGQIYMKGEFNKEQLYLFFKVKNIFVGKENVI